MTEDKTEASAERSAILSDLYDNAYLSGAEAVLSIFRSAIEGAPESKYTILVAELVKIVEADFVRHLRGTKL